MVRLAFRDAVGVLAAAALATACLGGQTGQPTSILGCDPTELEPGDSWHGVTVRATAQAFEGAYSAGLEWQEEPRSSTLQTPVALVDSIQLTITYSNEEATRSCADELNVPVSVSLSSSASGLVDNGKGTLTLSSGSPEGAATLHFESQRVSLDAMLTPPRAQGSLDAHDLALPGGSATFSEGQ